MLSQEFIKKAMKPALYELKEGTSTSYAYVSGSQLLPKTISIIRIEDASKVSCTGRGMLPRVGQMKSYFTKAEASPYKQYKPFKVQTAIWPAEPYRTLFYGTIGLTGSNGRIGRDNGDLIVFYTADWKQVQVFVFIGLAEAGRLAGNLAEALDFLKGSILKP